MQNCNGGKKRTIPRISTSRSRKSRLESISCDMTEPQKTPNEPEQLYRAMMANAHFGMVLIDANYKILNVNKMVSTYFRKSASELIGRRCYKEFEKRSSICPHCPGTRAMATGKQARVETEVVRGDGTRFSVSIQAFPTIEPDGKRTGFIEIIEDITERKRAEEAYHALVDHSLQGLAIFQEGRVVFANRTMAQITGYSVEQMLAMPAEKVQEFVHPEDRTLVWTRHQQRLAGKNVPARYQFRGIRRDGTLCWLELNASRIVYQGQPAIQAAYIDITERKKIEDALKESEEKYRDLFENARDAIFITDAEAKITGVNKLVEEYGFKKEQLLGKSIFEFIVQEQKERGLEDFKAAIGGNPVRGEMDVVTPRGIFTVEYVVNPIKRGGEIIGIQAMLREITERKKTQQKALDYQAQLKSSASELTLAEERERHRLATELHDQIGQPLAISKIKLDRLRHFMRTGEQTRALEEVCNTLGQAISQVRSLTFDLSSPILHQLGFEAAAAAWLVEQVEAKHGISTEFEDDGHTKPLDDDVRVLLFRNLRELLINVVKHASAHKVKVSVRRLDKNIQIVVKDNGVGFELAELKAGRGGFGLFSIKERLEQMGGRLEVESEPGHGCKVTMTAPLKRDET